MPKGMRKALPSKLPPQTQCHFPRNSRHQSSMFQERGKWYQKWRTTLPEWRRIQRKDVVSVIRLTMFPGPRPWPGAPGLVNHIDPSAPPSHAERRNGVPRRMQGVIEEVLLDAWGVIGINLLGDACKNSNCDLGECQVLSLVQARKRFAMPSVSNGVNLGRSRCGSCDKRSLVAR